MGGLLRAPSVGRRPLSGVPSVTSAADTMAGGAWPRLLSCAGKLLEVQPTAQLARQGRARHSLSPKACILTGSQG